MSFKRSLHLLVLGMLLATLLAACGNATTAPSTNATTAATGTATTAAAGAATTAATAVTTTVAATTAAAPATTAATAMTGTATTAAAPATTAATAVTTTVAATTGTGATTGGQKVDLIEDVKMDANGKKGGQLVYAFSGQFPSSLQPYYISDNVAIILVFQVYGVLVGQSNNAKYYANLLKEVPTVENGDVKVAADNKSMAITLKLKPGLKWSDGSPLTSKDVAYTWKWATDPDNSGVQTDLTGFNLIKSIDTPDDSTAVLNFSQVYGPYLNFLNSFWPLPEKVWSKIPLKDGGAEKSPEATKPTVTSGPMMVEDFVADDRVILARNENFSPVWGFNAYLDKVIFRNTPDANAALAGVSKGDLDEAENLDDNQGTAAANVPNAKFDIAQQFSWEYLQFNLTNPIFADKNVRKALDMGIDKAALIKQFRTPKTQQIAVSVSPLSVFNDKSLVPTKFDPEAAKKLLDAAGWKVGSDGIREKDGKKFAFTLSSTTAPIRKATAEVMLKYWKDLGADVKFSPYKSTEFFGSWNSDGILSRGKFDIGMFAQVGGIDPDSAYTNYHSSQIPTDANKGNGQNYGRINDKTIDASLDAQRATVDQGKRAQAWLDYQKALYDNTYEGYLYSRVNNYVISNKVQNFKPNPTTDGNFWDVVELYLK